MKYLILFIMMISGFINSFAQIELPEAFNAKLQRVGLEFQAPVEGLIKKVSLHENDIFQADIQLKPRKNKFEVLLKIDEILPNSYFGQVPHLKAINTSSNVATNAEDSHIVVHSMNAGQLAAYGADWGAIYFYKPKSNLTSFSHCKQISYYKKGKATVTILCFFNDTDLDTQPLENLLVFP